MSRLFDRYYRRRTLVQVFCDFALIFVSFTAAYLFLAEHGVERAVPATHGLSLVAALLFINTASGLYGASSARPIHWWARTVLAMALAMLLSYMVFDSLPGDFAYRQELRWMTMLCIAGVVAHRAYAARCDGAGQAYSRVLILGAGAAAQLVTRTINTAKRPIKIVGYVLGPNESQSVVDASQLLNGPTPLKDRVAELGVDEIIVALSERRGGNMPMLELLDCRSVGVRVSDLSMYFERMLGQIRIDHLHPGWLIFGKGFNHSIYRDAAKRLFDIMWSCVLLALAAPVMLVTAICIAVESGGPILYRQERVGRDNKTFSLWKFRSMRVDAEKNGTPQWAAAKDARVTRVGATIRRFRIDELPQLVNVLKGEMSLVGPRPERPFFVKQLTAEIPFYALRHSVKPGVTGWAQVQYQYGASLEDSMEKLQYDLYYVKNHSLLLDIVVLFETIGVVLSGQGAR